jgi:two-component system, chemotaxis family, protein-glutamate methylesterase/glutaminase
MTQRRDIIVIGASAGGVTALAEIVEALDPNLRAAVFVVLHLPANHRSHLPSILNRSGPLPASNAEDGADIEYGHIYVAPPDFHLLLGGGSIHVARGPRVNRSRPSIDLLFQSASAAHTDRVIGVIASGLLDDGVRGLATIKRRGGIAIVQDPDEATFSGMPSNAIETVAVDHIHPAGHIGKVLNDLVAHHQEGVTHMQHDEPTAPRETQDDYNETREISPFTCPDCHGMLWEIEEGSLVHYQCRVGHSFTPSALLSAQVDEVEGLLWGALRAMEEREAIYRNIQERNLQLGVATFEASLENKIQANQRHAEMLRQILLGEESFALPSNGGGDADDDGSRIAQAGQ